jgi:predicted dehydrogenase
VEAVRWGILSTARINAAVIPPLRESPDSEIIAVASRTQERADTYARQWRIPRVYGSYEALLEDPDVEAIYISLPNGPHIEWSIRCLEAGKHVLCEKPLTRSPDEVERAFDVADSAGLLLMEAFMYRHHPQTARLVELVREGAVGDLRQIRASFSFQIEGVNVRLEPQLAGGALMDVGCYCVSGSRLIASEAESASAHQALGPSGVDLRLTGTLVFLGGVHAQLDCAFDLPLRQSLEVFGSEGTLRVTWPWNVRAPGILLQRGEEVEHVVVAAVDAYRLQSDNFSRAIRGVEEPLLGRSDAVSQARTIDSLYRSAEAGGEPMRP